MYLETWIHRYIEKGVILDFTRPGKRADKAFIEAFNGCSDQDA